MALIFLGVASFALGLYLILKNKNRLLGFGFIGVGIVATVIMIVYLILASKQ